MARIRHPYAQKAKVAGTYEGSLVASTSMDDAGSYRMSLDDGRVKRSGLPDFTLRLDRQEAETLHLNLSLALGLSSETGGKNFVALYRGKPRNTLEQFTENTAPKWLTGSHRESEEASRQFWEEKVLTLSVGEFVETKYRTILRLS